jgi:thioredoxin-dependent peroxiredoxin
MSAYSLRIAILTCTFGFLVVIANARADDKKDETIELKVGDVVPKFSLHDDKDATWSLSDHVGKKWVLVYFYPGDFTPGCTVQANAFRDAMNKLKEQGVEVVGVSGDSITTHRLFKSAQKLNFTLLADEDGAIARKFGVPVGPGGKMKANNADGNMVEINRTVTAARWTFVVAKDGTVAYKNTKVVPANDAKRIIEFIANAEGKRVTGAPTHEVDR